MFVIQDPLESCWLYICDDREENIPDEDLKNEK